MDGATGELRIASPLTGKGRRDPYALTVRAQDAGSPPLSADVPVSVFIGDVVRNDGVPSFVHPALDEVAYVSEVGLWLFLPALFLERGARRTLLFDHIKEHCRAFCLSLGSSTDRLEGAKTIC